MNIDFSKQAQEATIELKKFSRKFKNKDKKINQRKTTHTRIRIDWLSKLKSSAKKEKMSISKLMDRVLTYYFKNNKSFE